MHSVCVCVCVCSKVHFAPPVQQGTGGSRRDGSRGDSVVVNGGRHGLDLVALIAYFKLKKRCQGLSLYESCECRVGANSGPNNTIFYFMCTLS